MSSASSKELIWRRTNRRIVLACWRYNSSISAAPETFDCGDKFNWCTLILCQRFIFLRPHLLIVRATLTVTLFCGNVEFLWSEVFYVMYKLSNGRRSQRGLRGNLLVRRQGAATSAAGTWGNLLVRRQVAAASAAATRMRLENQGQKYTIFRGSV